MATNYTIVKTKHNHYRICWAAQTQTGLNPIVGPEFEIVGGKAGLKKYIENFRSANFGDSIIVID